MLSQRTGPFLQKEYTMDKVEKVDSQEVEVKKRGRPKKQDPATPLGQYRVEQAKEARDKKQKDTIVETYYELVSGNKLRLCKVKKSGSVAYTYVGCTAVDGEASKEAKKRAAELRQMAEKLQKEGRLRVRV